MVRLERFVSSCNEEFHGYGAGWLLGWHTEVRDLKLRRIAEELCQVSSVKLLERSECGRPVTLKKEKEINALAMATTQCRDRLRSWQASWRRERHRGASLDRVAQVLDKLTTQQVQQPVAMLVDTRGKGRPSNFGSGEEKSLEKSSQCGRGRCRTRSSVQSQIFVEWVATTAVPITHQFVEQGFGSEVDQVTDLEDKICTKSLRC